MLRTAGVMKTVGEVLLMGGDGMLIPRDGIKNRSAAAQRYLYIYNIIYNINAHMQTMSKSVPPDPLAPRNTAARPFVRIQLHWPNVQTRFDRRCSAAEQHY